MITLDGTTPVGDTGNMWHLKTETLENAKKNFLNSIVKSL